MLKLKPLARTLELIDPREGAAGLRLSSRSGAAQWALLIAASMLASAGLQAVALPAALLLGPMAAGILIGVNGGTVRVPRVPYLGAQSIIGCMIAKTITPAIVLSFLHSWPLFMAIVLSTIMASSLAGWLMSRSRVLPGTTGIWGSSPGAASAMVVMADEFGSDARLVAFMQYLRVVCVTILASLIAHFWGNTANLPRVDVAWFPPIHWLPFAGTLLVAGIGAIAGQLLKIPSGALVVPLAAGAILHLSGLIEIELPKWLLTATYAMLGWTIGLRFTRKVLAHASHAIPLVLLSIVLLIAFCGGLAFVLTRALQIDPLTAYLATSPGGLDSIAIIAAGSNADMSFVMALQTVRLALVILLGPPLARLLASRAAGEETATQSGKGKE